MDAVHNARGREAWLRSPECPGPCACVWRCCCCCCARLRLQAGPRCRTKQQINSMHLSLVSSDIDSVESIETVPSPGYTVRTGSYMHNRSHLARPVSSDAHRLLALLTAHHNRNVRRTLSRVNLQRGSSQRSWTRGETHAFLSLSSALTSSVAKYEARFAG